MLASFSFVMQSSSTCENMPLATVADDHFSQRNDSVISEPKDEPDGSPVVTKPQAGHWGESIWDPKASWTAEEEQQVVLKTDLRLLSFFCMATVAIFIDRGIIYNALTDNFLMDAGLTKEDYKVGLQVSRVGVLIAQWPLQLAVNRFGFRKVFSPLLMCWGVLGEYMHLQDLTQLTRSSGLSVHDQR